MLSFHASYHCYLYCIILVLFCFHTSDDNEYLLLLSLHGVVALILNVPCVIGDVVHTLISASLMCHTCFAIPCIGSVPLACAVL